MAQHFVYTSHCHHHSILKGQTRVKCLATYAASNIPPSRDRNKCFAHRMSFGTEWQQHILQRSPLSSVCISCVHVFSIPILRWKDERPICLWHELHVPRVCVCVYSHHLDLYLGGLVPLPEAHRSLWPKSPKTNCVVLFRWYVETSRYIADNPVNKIDWIGSDSFP